MAKKRGRPKKNPETTTQSKEKTPFEKTMGKKLDKNGNVRVTVMTKSASEIADERIKNRPDSKFYNSDCIHRPKG